MNLQTKPFSTSCKQRLQIPSPLRFRTSHSRETVPFRLQPPLGPSIPWTPFPLHLLLPLLLLIATTLAHAQEASLELLVKWKEGPQSTTAALDNDRLGATVVRNYPNLGWQLVRARAGLGLAEALREYRALDSVKVVEPNGVIRSASPTPPSAAVESGNPARMHSLTAATLTPNDPRFYRQTNLLQIAAPAAWAITNKSPDVVIAILETGADYTNPDLAANMWRNPGESGLDAEGRNKATNGRDDDANGYVDDVYGINVQEHTSDPMDLGVFFLPEDPRVFYHGTGVAGTIAAAGNNGFGIAGVTWSAKIMAIRVGGADMNGPEFSLSLWWSNVVEAFDYIIGMKRRGVNVRVTNNSYGDASFSRALEDALRISGEEGILNVFSAGNMPNDTDFHRMTGGYYDSPSIIDVASIDVSDTLSSWTTFGRSTVHLAAPGEHIQCISAGNRFYWGTGTSFACPQVVGAAALLLAVKPNASVDELKTALLGSVDQNPSMKDRLITGGRLNVARALNHILHPEEAPTIVITARPAGPRKRLLPSEITVTFSRPMDRASVEAAFEIVPPLDPSPHRFQWSDDSRTFHLDTAGAAAPDLNSQRHTLRIRGTARDVRGMGLDGNFNRQIEGSPSDDHVWVITPQTAHDDFDTIASLSGESGSVDGSNLYATPEILEPDHAGDRTSAASVWYSWTAPRDGWFTFDLTGRADFDSLLAVYTGDSLESLVPVAGNDDYGTNRSGRVSFRAAAGVDYRIAVASKSRYATKELIDASMMGPFRLAYYSTPVPDIASLSPPTAWAGQKVTVFGSDLSGTTRVAVNGVAVPFSPPDAESQTDLALVFTVPQGVDSGILTVETPHGTATTAIPFTVLPLPSLAVEAVPGGGIRLSWPRSAERFVLEVSDVVAPSPTWRKLSPVTAQPEDPANIRVIDAPGLARRYYRLRLP